MNQKAQLSIPVEVLTHSELSLQVYDLVENITGPGISIGQEVKDKTNMFTMDIAKEINELWEYLLKSSEIINEINWFDIDRLIFRSWLNDGEIHDNEISL